MNNRRSSSRTRLVRTACAAAFSILVLHLTGCGGGVGEVSGKITYKGKPVVYGTVGYVGSDGLPRSARINPDGTYTVKDVASGEAKITVVSELPAQGQAKGAGRAGRQDNTPGALKDPRLGADEPGVGLGRGEVAEVVDPEVAKKWFPIPPELGDVAKTKLRFTVRKGPNTNDIQLD